MKKAVVSGASGFLGRELCKELAEQGVSVIGIVRDMNSDTARELCRIDGINLVESNLLEERNLAEKIKDRDIDVFFHLAWDGVYDVMRGNEEVQIKNIELACKLVYFCHEIGCQRFFFASSIMEYELQAFMEKEVDIGINFIYSAAKLSAYYMTRILANKLGIIYLRGIISNVYGPGDQSKRMINSTIKKMLQGEHCAFSSGEQKYDFIYIEDAIDMMILIGRKGKNNRSYYIGSQHPHILKEYLKKIQEIISPESILGFGELPSPPVSLNYDEFDLYAVKNDFGIVAKVGFEEGIRRTKEWIQKENREKEE